MRDHNLSAAVLAAFAAGPLHVEVEHGRYPSAPQPATYAMKRAPTAPAKDDNKRKRKAKIAAASKRRNRK